MNRIIEAFTRAHDQVTGIDELVMAAVIVPVVIVIIVIYLWILNELG